MRLLFDTCALLWWFAREGLSQTAQRAIRDPANQLHISAGSAWEIAIKHSLGKLVLPESPREVIAAALDETPARGIVAEFDHVIRAGSLPLHHRDPFDRLLVAQAQIENLTLVTPDPLFKPYDVPLLW